MSEIIICASTNIFRIYLIRKFIHIFLGEKEQENWKDMVVCSAFFVTNTAFFLIFHLAWINILSNLMGIGAMAALHTKSLRTNLFVTCSIYLINMVCDTGVIIFFVDYKDGEGFRQIYSILTVILIFICELLTEKIVRHKKNADAVHNLPLITVPICSIAMISFTIYGKNKSDAELPVICVGLLIINFLVFYLYNMLLKAFSQKYENEMLRQKIKIYANEIDVILQSEDRVKALRHDMKHHMNELKLLAMKNDSAAIQAYIDDMREFIHNPNELVSSGNLEIDSILNYLLQRAKQALKTVRVNVQLPKAVCHAFDINIILGNLLENAIEAAEQTEEKTLDVSVRLRQGVLRIEIGNSCSGKLIRRNREKEGGVYFRTTKKDGEHHGIGLGSVSKIVEKYNGIMEAGVRDGYFLIRLILYMPRPENA